LLPVFIQALRKPFGLPGKPFGSNQGRHSNCKPLCLYSLPEPHDSVRRPFVGLDGRDLRDGVFIQNSKFESNLFDFFCVLFFEIYFFALFTSSGACNQNQVYNVRNFSESVR